MKYPDPYINQPGNHGSCQGLVHAAHPVRLLIDMKAGIGHLAEKLHVVKLEDTTVDPNDP